MLKSQLANWSAVNEASLTLTKSTIKSLAHTTSYSRGRDLLRDGALDELTRHGDLFSGECEGSEGSVYRLSARIVDGQVSDANCTCPYSYSGICKHLVALLLAWEDQPEKFSDLAVKPKEKTSTLLKKLLTKNREELADLIVQLVESDPKLAPVIKSLLQNSLSPKDIADFKKQVEKILQRAVRIGYELNFRQVRRDLKEPVRAAAALVESRPLDAAELYAVILKALMDEGSQLFDFEGCGTLTDVSNECVVHLCNTIPQAQEEQRIRWLKLLAEAHFFEIYDEDVEFAEEAFTAMEEAKPEDWAQLEPLLIKLAEEEEASTDKPWKRQNITDLKIAHLSHIGDKEAAQRLIMTHGRPEQQREVLLQQQDFGKVMQQTREAFQPHAMPRLRLAYLLNSAGQWELAKEWAREHGMQNFLAEYSIKNGDPEATEINLQLFRQHPTLAQWQQVLSSVPEQHRIALSDGLWHEMEDRHLYGIQYEIKIHQDDLPAAIEIRPKLDASSQVTHRKQFAEATEKEFPDLSVQLWTEMAEICISEKTTTAYSSAAYALSHVKAILIRQGRAKEWTPLCLDFKTRHFRVKALQLEMAKLGM